MKKNPRIEITITKADKDIEAFLNASDTPNATLFKIAMRSYMQQKEDEQLDMRIKRLLDEALSKFTHSPIPPAATTLPIVEEQTITPTPQKNSRLSFGVKKF